LAWMGFSGLGPERSKLHLRAVCQELPDGMRAVVWTEGSEVRSLAHTTLADYPLPQAGTYMITLKSPTVFRAHGDVLRPTLTLITESATRRMARFAGLDLEHRRHVEPRGRMLWMDERRFHRRSRREGEQDMRGWIGAFEVHVDDPAHAAPFWSASLIGVGRHTTFGFGDVELDTVDAYLLPQGGLHHEAPSEIDL
jgi:CRISPR/Cas system endoribonuclease Cas6 (RAMP superfamily)